MRRRWLSGILIGVFLVVGSLVGCRQKTVEEQVEEALSKIPPASEFPDQGPLPMAIDPANPPSGPPPEAMEEKEEAVGEADSEAADQEEGMDEEAGTESTETTEELPDEELPAGSGE